MISFIIHAWFRGHSVDTYRYASALSKTNGKGWLMHCECGKEWTR